MFGNKKLKQKIENLEKELASAKRDIRILWDVCEPQINAKLEQGMQEVVTALAKIFNVNVETAKEEKKEKSATIGKKVVKKQAVSSDVGNKTENVKKKIERPRDSILRKYYKQMNLNLNVRGFKENGTLDEVECATLLYLFDQYKYIDEIAKHIKLSKASIIRYTYVIKNEGYLIFNHGMGRVANGCLIYNVGV